MGVEREVVSAGTGPKPTVGQKVTVHCTGYGKNGDLSQKFWSTKDPGQNPFSFQIGKGAVIKGWDEGVLQMQVGEVARLRIMLMVLTDLVHGGYNLIRLWFLRLKSSVRSKHLGRESDPLQIYMVILINLLFHGLILVL